MSNPVDVAVIANFARALADPHTPTADRHRGRSARRECACHTRKA
jgi:predicted methyltransferase